MTPTQTIEQFFHPRSTDLVHHTDIRLTFGELSPTIDWCQRNCEADWTYEMIEDNWMYRFRFRSEKDYVTFLVWKK